MDIYIVSIFASMFLTYLNVRIKGLKLIVKAFFSALPLSLIAGLRYNVGSDYFSYIYEYQKINDGIESRMEPLYVLINKVLGALGLPPQWILIFTSFLFFTLVFYVILRDSKDIYMSIFLLYGTTIYFMFMNGTRQLLAISIAYTGFHYIKNQEFLKYLTVILFASLFHYSCIVMLPLYMINRVRINNVKCISIIILTVIFQKFISEKIYLYISQLEYYSYFLSIESSSLPVWYFVNLAGFILSFVVLKNKDNIYYVCQLIIVCLGFFYYSIPMILRLIWVFSLAQIIAIPEAIACIKNKKLNYIIKIVVIFMFYIYSYYSIFINGSHDVSMYSSYLFN